MNQPVDRRIVAIFTVVLIDVLGMTIMLPLLPFYSEHFGASTQVVGLLISSYALCQLIAGPILGHLSDRYGRRPVLIVSQIGTFIGFLILANAQTLTWIFISRIIDGLTAGNLSTAQAYITDVTEPKNRAAVLGKIGIAFGIGFFVGPALTAFFSQFSYQAPIYAAAALSFTSIMGSIFLLPAGDKSHQSATTGVSAPLTTYKTLLQKSGIRTSLIEISFFFFAFSAFMSGLALFSEHRFMWNDVPLNPKEIGYIFTYFGFLQIVIQSSIIGKLIKRYGERKVQMIGFVTSFIGYTALCLIANPFLVAATGLFSSLGGGVLRPVLMSQLTAHAAPNERGRVIGLSQSIQSVAQILMPIASTAIIGSAFIATWGLLPGLISLAGAAMTSYISVAKSK
ncbi:MAG: MFS transporter [Pseudobdellovibrio sp.]